MTTSTWANSLAKPHRFWLCAFLTGGLMLLAGLVPNAQAARGVRPPKGDSPPAGNKGAEGPASDRGQAPESSRRPAGAGAGTNAYTPEHKVESGTLLGDARRREAIERSRGTPAMRGPIKISDDDWQHLRDGHIQGGKNSADKSVFYGKEDGVRALIRKAESNAVFQQRTPQGNYERVVNAGRPIGIDKVTGKPTSVYTVVTRPDNSFKTAFPGVPEWRQGGLKKTYVESVQPPKSPAPAPPPP